VGLGWRDGARSVVEYARGYVLPRHFSRSEAGEISIAGGFRSPPGGEGPVVVPPGSGWDEFHCMVTRAVCSVFAAASARRPAASATELVRLMALMIFA
jgi:hypothetical protein